MRKLVPVQHLDLSRHRKRLRKKIAYLNSSVMKSAFAAECACYAGALLAGSRSGLINLFTTFGCNLEWPLNSHDIRGITGLKDINNRKIHCQKFFAVGSSGPRFMNC